MNKQEKQFTVKTFNPFEHQYPNRKVLTLNEIHLIKFLKSQGYRVDILPDDSRPVDYIFRKGYQEFLNSSLPFILTIWQEIPKEIILSAISDWYKSTFFSKSSSKIPDAVTKNFVYVENFSGNMYNLNGEGLSGQDASTKLYEVEGAQRAYQKAFLQKPLYIDLPTPIYRQHNPHVIGWAKLLLDDDGLRVDKSVVTDKQAWQDVVAKKLRGFSVAGLATQSVCNICNSNYVFCEHISGTIYGNQGCYNTISSALLAECSLVETPANSGCMVVSLPPLVSQF